jgi:hypothetical protein
MRRRRASSALTMVIPFRVNRIDQGPEISTGRRTFRATSHSAEVGSQLDGDGPPAVGQHATSSAGAVDMNLINGNQMGQ